jgi:kynurenine formamidase
VAVSIARSVTQRIQSKSKKAWRGVTATGHESMDADITDKMDSETYILQHGHYQIEVMANLDKVPPTGAVIVVTWPKVEKGLGFPARAFAILP